jgi:hypothetical protein
MDRLILSSFALLLVGCGGTPGAQPHDMSVAQHEAAARGSAKPNEAADHRAAAAALADAETRACSGLPAETRGVSPFEHSEDLAGVAPLVETVGTPKSPVTRTAGAIVTLRATPGVTAEWLQRVVDCHLAHTAALDVRDMPSCPLVPRGATARVSSTGTGFAVAIRSDDEATAREILARAQRLWDERARTGR